MDESTPDRLVLAIVQIDDVGDLIHRLVERGFRATRIDAAGGFLRRENAAVLVGTTGEKVSAVMATIRETCRTRTATWLPTLDDGGVGLYADPIDVEIGGAVVFVLPLAAAELLRIAAPKS